MVRVQLYTIKNYVRKELNISAVLYNSVFNSDTGHNM